MAFASSLLPVPPYRVCATPASEVAAFSPAKKSVSLAAARQRRGSRHGGNPCLCCPNTLSLSPHFLSAPARCACPRPALV
ncbi:universal stress family protein [Zea mays]|uniref:Universal stress family protein n=1 Tax=Zea mays TaxID=4577 RepID=A0A1D6IPQ4_MAIZE|nr:universal stress family protein [Zea mays]